ncbi:MAG: hypothetical protein COZ18_02695 [Flexibacter sp. CG_4_10_14_3_um_filter_32_15]|nr:MAG: hypothetical protein COZ18_02695 [Flexibacter sp. CG_4_10_14_3_um_filter_32_15]
MKSKIVVLLVLFVCSSFARPIVFNIQKELREAQNIVEGKILNYNTKDTKVIYQNITTGKIDTAIAIGHILSKPTFELDQNTISTNRSILSGCVPMVGEEVLIVINDSNKVRLFAYKKDEYYRFWTPQAATSLSLFSIELPTLPIFPNDDYYNKGGVCFDGCLYPLNKIELRQ